MSNIRSYDEPVERMAKLMAALYTHLGRELISNLGEKQGQEAVRRAIKAFADERIESMQAEAKERNLPINGDTYKKVRDMPGTGWIKDSQNTDTVLYCPMYAMWQQQDAGDLAKLYCEIDQHLFEAFHVDMVRPFCLSDGDTCCKFILSDKGS